MHKQNTFLKTQIKESLITKHTKFRGENSKLEIKFSKIKLMSIAADKRGARQCRLEEVHSQGLRSREEAVYSLGGDIDQVAYG